MPIYEYECEGCAHRFELRQHFNEEPISQCPVCQGKARRVFHSVPVMFRGSGWYVNDYGRGKKPEDGSSPSKAEPSTTGDKEQGAKPEKESHSEKR